jgi:hypothetical protein
MWRNSIAGMRDMYLTRSSDGGRTFAPAAKLGKGTWPLKGCPMDGGSLAISPAGRIATIWRRDNDILFASDQGQAETRLGSGRNPWAAATVAGTYFVWVQARHAPLQLLMPGTKQPLELAPRANDAVVAAAASGKGPVVAAWEEQRGKGSAIICQVIVRDPQP